MWNYLAHKFVAGCIHLVIRSAFEHRRTRKRTRLLLWQASRHWNPLPGTWKWKPDSCQEHHGYPVCYWGETSLYEMPVWKKTVNTVNEICDKRSTSYIVGCQVRVDHLVCLNGFMEAEMYDTVHTLNVVLTSKWYSALESSVMLFTRLLLLILQSFITAKARLFAHNGLNCIWSCRGLHVILCLHC